MARDELHGQVRIGERLKGVDMAREDGRHPGGRGILRGLRQHLVLPGHKAQQGAGRGPDGPVHGEPDGAARRQSFEGFELGAVAGDLGLLPVAFACGGDIHHNQAQPAQIHRKGGAKTQAARG